MMDYGLDAVTLEQYSGGYRMRLGGMLLLDDATSAWRCGWNDADTDRLELARHRKVVGEGLEDSYEATWGVLFDAGREARLHGIGFDEGKTEPWQAGWVKADISAGVAGTETVSDEEGHSESNALPMWPGEDPGARSVCDLLYVEATG